MSYSNDRVFSQTLASNTRPVDVDWNALYLVWLHGDASAYVLFRAGEMCSANRPHEVLEDDLVFISLVAGSFRVAIGQLRAELFECLSELSIAFLLFFICGLPITRLVSWVFVFSFIIFFLPICWFDKWFIPLLDRFVLHLYLIFLLLFVWFLLLSTVSGNDVYQDASNYSLWYLE